MKEFLLAENELGLKVFINDEPIYDLIPKEIIALIADCVEEELSNNLKSKKSSQTTPK